MLKIFDSLADWMQLQGMKANTIAHIDGISLASNRPHQNGVFKQIIEGALSLVRKHDPRRYARITQHFRWILNAYLVGPMDGMFVSSTRTCVINFGWLPGANHDLLEAMYAGILVHESTHAVLEFRGIRSEDENRLRIERLCFEEQNRFIARLAAADPVRFPRRVLHIKFDDHLYKQFYNNPLRRGFSLLSRLASITALE